MCDSSATYKKEIREYLLKNFPREATVLDVGPGQGTYWELLHDHFTSMDAVEIWPKYIEEFNLEAKYRKVYAADICGLDIPAYDIIILGDVLEHLPVDKAPAVVAGLLDNCREMVVSVPFHLTKRVLGGNPYQRHTMPDLDADGMARMFPGLEVLFPTVADRWFQLAVYHKKKVAAVPNCAAFCTCDGSFVKYAALCIKSFLRANPSAGVLLWAVNTAPAALEDALGPVYRRISVRYETVPDSVPGGLRVYTSVRRFHTLNKWLRESPGVRKVFALDVDMVVRRCMAPVFSLLDTYDICAPWRPELAPRDVFLAACVGIANTPGGLEFLQEYERQAAALQDQWFQDQHALAAARRAMPDLRFANLGPEWWSCDWTDADAYVYHAGGNRKRRDKTYTDLVGDKTAFMPAALPERCAPGRAYDGPHTPFQLIRARTGERTLLDTYRGQAVFMVCNGPSLDDTQLRQLLTPGIIRFGMNNGPAMVRPHIWTCADDPSRFLQSIWTDPTIWKLVDEGRRSSLLWDSNAWQPANIAVDECPSVYYFRQDKHFAPEEWVDSPTVCWAINGEKTKRVFRDGGKAYPEYRSVMLMALKLAVALGFSRIYISGADFNMDPEKPYGFDETKAPGACASNNRMYEGLNAGMTLLQPVLAARGISVVNCTVGGNLTAFPREPLEDAVRRETALVGAVLDERVAGMYHKAYTGRRHNTAVATPPRPAGRSVHGNEHENRVERRKQMWRALAYGEAPPDIRTYKGLTSDDRKSLALSPVSDSGAGAGYVTAAELMAAENSVLALYPCLVRPMAAARTGSAGGCRGCAPGRAKQALESRFADALLSDPDKIASLPFHPDRTVNVNGAVVTLHQIMIREIVAPAIPAAIRTVVPPPPVALSCEGVSMADILAFRAALASPAPRPERYSGLVTLMKASPSMANHGIRAFARRLELISLQLARVGAASDSADVWEQSFTDRLDKLAALINKEK